MRIPLAKSQPSVLGLDVGAQSVKLVQVRPREGEWQVQAADSRVLPEAEQDRTPEMIADLIRIMLAEGEFTSRRVISCLPASAVQYKNLRLPKMPPEELAQAVRWEASERLHLGSDAFQIQYLDAGEVRQGDEAREELIVLAVQSALVEKHVAMLSACGLTPDAIDAVPGALSRFAQQWESRDPPKPRHKS